MKQKLQKVTATALQHPLCFQQYQSSLTEVNGNEPPLNQLSTCGQHQPTCSQHEILLHVVTVKLTVCVRELFTTRSTL